MCGIVGILGGRGVPERESIVHRMAASLVHRGPDGAGHVTRGPCTLGFQRLAIVDLGAESAPYSEEQGSVWTVANAEIYNVVELRAELERRGHSLRTSVDTEVIPHLYEEHGVGLVDHLNGMFAFGLWDTHRERLLLARDRAGEKPLFWWRGPSGEIVFASEMRALLAHPDIAQDIDPVAVRRYLLHGYFPAPLTPIAGIHKLPAGEILVAEGGGIERRTYWDLANSFASSALAGRREADLAEELDARIALAVERRRRSDVPVGVFLSGGIDSSTILAHMAEQQGPGVPAFSLGHVDLSFDESRYAARTAEFFEADFHQLVLDEADLAEGLRLIGESFDEPLGDASTIPSHLLARFARERVKVILSGEGADELLGGYPTYLGHRLVRWYQRLPVTLRRRLLPNLVRRLPVSMGNVGLDYLLAQFTQGAELELIERHHSWFGSLPPGRLDEVLAPRLIERLATDDPFASARAVTAGKTFPDDLAKVLYTDFVMYLQDDLLTKVDRATMLASLEARAPFLDHELAEFVAALPSASKVRRFRTKAILRRVARKRLPREVVTRRKRGFNIPFSRWLLHGLGDELRRRFATEKVEARGLLDPAGVGRLLDEHLAEAADHRKPLFALLALDMWCDRLYGEASPVPLAAATRSTPAVGSSVS